MIVNQYHIFKCISHRYIAIDNNNYTLFEKNNPEIALIVLYVYVNVIISHKEGKMCV